MMTKTEKVMFSLNELRMQKAHTIHKILETVKDKKEDCNE